MSTTARGPQLVRRGRIGYRPMVRRMEARRRAVAAGDAPEAIFTCRHPPTITLGRGFDGPEPVVPEGVDVVETNRGGAATYHGPGQAVVYPVCDLRPRGKDVRGFLRLLEASIVEALGKMGLEAEADPEMAGVICRGKKVASIGIAVRQWVTMHGLAVNVTPDLSHFRWIRPCGMSPHRIGSLAELLDEEPETATVERNIVDALRRRLRIPRPEAK